MAFTITINDNGGSGSIARFYGDGEGNYYSDRPFSEATEITSITQLPTRAAYTFTGYWTHSGGGDKCVYADGSFRSKYLNAIKSDATLYAQWSPQFYTVSVDLDGGRVGTATTLEFYTKKTLSNGETRKFYSDKACTQQMTSISVPARECYEFAGADSTKADAGTEYVSQYGVLQSALAAVDFTGDIRIYAKWNRVSHKVTLDANGGTAGTRSAVYVKSDLSNAIYGAAACAAADQIYQLEDAEMPTRAGYAFNSYRLDNHKATNGAGDGSFLISGGTYVLVSLVSRDISEEGGSGDITLIAKWNPRFYAITLDRAGGTGGSDAIYGKRSDGTATTFYTDKPCTVQIGANGVKVQVPTRTGYTFTGYFSTASGGTKYVSNSGNIINSLSVSADITLYAQWTANSYTLTLPNASPSTKTVTFDAEIGTLPTPTIADALFQTWLVDGTPISNTTIWTWASNMTAVAQVLRSFGSVIDYFGYGGANLVPIESDSGENKPRIVTRHYGKFLKKASTIVQQEGADAASSLIWRNPTVKYMVVGSVNFAIQLGRAWKGTTSSTGYMIKSVIIDTRMHNFPTITVSAVANEGVDAINQFDIGTFGNTVSVLPRARAQALMNAINPGTGHLQACTLKVSCDPVVLAENMVPCASDVVNGRIEVAADVLFTDVNNRTEPSAGTGFTIINSDATRGGTAYNTYRIAARKEL